MPIDEFLGDKIRAIRQSKSMSQSTLANSLGVSFQQVQKYEKGSNRLSVGRLCQICQALDVPIASMFEDVPPALSRPAQERRLNP